MASVDQRRAARARAGLARVALASLLFGLAGIFVRLAYDHGADVATVLFVRGLGVLPWLLVFALPGRLARTRGLERQLLAMGVLGALNVSTYFAAVSRMSPALVSLVYYAYPALVIVAAHLLGWNRFDRLTAAAAAATFAGVALTIGLPQGGADNLGVALAIVNAVGYAAYILLAQAVLRRIDPITCIAFVGGLSSVLLLAATASAGVHMPGDGRALASLGALLAATLFPHVLLLSGVGRLGGPWGSIAACLEVVTTVVATAIVFGLPLGAGLVAGGVLVLAGGVVGPILASRRGTRAAPAQPLPLAADGD